MLLSEYKDKYRSDYDETNRVLADHCERMNRECSGLHYKVLGSEYAFLLFCDDDPLCTVSPVEQNGKCILVTEPA